MFGESELGLVAGGLTNMVLNTQVLNARVLDHWGLEF